MEMEEFDRLNLRVNLEYRLIGARSGVPDDKRIKELIDFYEAEIGGKYLPYSAQKPMEQEEINKWRFVIDSHHQLLEKVNHNPAVIEASKNETRLLFEIITGLSYDHLGAR
jgi:hypothetical protein